MSSELLTSKNKKFTSSLVSTESNSLPYPIYQKIIKEKHNWKEVLPGSLHSKWFIFRNFAGIAIIHLMSWVHFERICGNKKKDRGRGGNPAAMKMFTPLFGFSFWESKETFFSDTVIRNTCDFPVHLFCCIYLKEILKYIIYYISSLCCLVNSLKQNYGYPMINV